MPLIGSLGHYFLSSTAYFETTLILFLHILGAMVTMGGSLGLLVLYTRAQGAQDMAELRMSAALIATFGRRVLAPAAGLTGVIGLILAYRFDARGLFKLSGQGWLVVAVVLWLILQMVAARGIRAMEAVIDSAGAEDDLATLKTRLGAGGVAARFWLVLVLTVLITYLMVFQPFAGT